METDSCEVKLSGRISCDGALIGLPEEFTYIPEANDQNAPQECNMFANFEIVTCCSDPVKKKSIESSTLCLESVKKPLCESCDGAENRTIAGVLSQIVDSTPYTYTTIWKVCQYFNVVGVAPKLYTTFSHNYDGNCELPCGPTPTLLESPDIRYTVGNPGQRYFRNYRRKWIIQRSTTLSVNEAGDLCCPSLAYGDIDEHGRLLPSGNDGNHGIEVVTPKDKTCNYCLDGSWHCNPEMILSFSGSINGPLKTEQFLNLLKNSDTEETSEETLRLTVDEDQISQNGGIQPKFCCNFKHDQVVPNWRTDTEIFGWVPNSEIQEDGSRKTRFVLERVPREDLWKQTYLSDIEISYKLQYFGEDNLLNPTGAFFRLDIVVDTGFTVETIVLDSHRICPTTDGKIDCNFLNQNNLYFNKIHRQSISIGKFLSSFGGSYDDILNGDEIVPTMTASNTYMRSDSANAEEGYCVKPEDNKNCNYSVDLVGYNNLGNFTTQRRVDGYVLKTCCCDNEKVVFYNTAVLDKYPDIDFAEDLNEIGKRCDCSSFAPPLTCLGTAGKRLAVIIIDESANVYTAGGCVCSNNLQFLADLAEFRDKAPNTNIVLIQPTMEASWGPGPCTSNNNSTWFHTSWLTGGCPLPQEVIGTVGHFPRDWDFRSDDPWLRNQRLTTYELLMFIYRYYSGGSTGIGDKWYGHDPDLDPFRQNGFFVDTRSLDERDPIDHVYSGMDIYRDTSGSVTDREFKVGVGFFMNGGYAAGGFGLLPSASETFPTATFTDQTFGDEAWLRYALKSKGGTKCLGIKDDPLCWRQVRMSLI